MAKIMYVIYGVLMYMSPGVFHAISYDTLIYGNLNAPGEADTFVFEGKTGDVVQIRFAVYSFSFAPEIKLLSPSDTLLAENADESRQQAKIIDFKLPDDGLYEIIAKDYNDSDTGSYWLSLQERNDVRSKADTINFNEIIEDSITKYGELKAFILNVQSPLMIRIEGYSNSGFMPCFEIFSPEDSLLASGYGEAGLHGNPPIDSLFLSNPGKYTIYLHGLNGDIGRYFLRVLSYPWIPPLDTIDNDIINIVFNHSQGCIKSIKYKKGSNRNFLARNQKVGLLSANFEEKTMVTDWSITQDSAYFVYANLYWYGTKKVIIKWERHLG